MALWKKLVLVVAGVLIGMPVLLFGTWRAGSWADNHFYAARMFEGIVDYDKVLASRRWFPLLRDEYFDCFYAAVRLSEDVTSIPPEQSNRKPGDDWGLEFGGDWMPTPGPTYFATERNPCEKRLQPELFDQMIAALETPGGWYRVKGGPRLTASNFDLWVYSAPKRLAYRLRFGD